jgi:rhodanese-related sulfurtransferase
MINSNPRLIVVDVRDQSEYCSETATPPGHIPGSLLYPWNSQWLQNHYTELPEYGDILVVCGVGGRSALASQFLCTNGFTSVHNMTGGMSAWTGETVGCCFADGDCDDGLFCTGTESCAALNCQPGSGDPCAGIPYYRCDEIVDSCVLCAGDYDCDGVNDAADNCLRTPNGPDLGSCVKAMPDLLIVYNNPCLLDTVCEQDAASCMKNQEDSNSDGIGDACECEADFDSDLDVDGSNASQIKADFGRNNLLNPCSPTASPCNGDFNCDGDVDGSDGAKFKEDYGRSAFSNPCSAGSAVNCE